MTLSVTLSEFVSNYIHRQALATSLLVVRQEWACPVSVGSYCEPPTGRQYALKEFNTQPAAHSLGPALRWIPIAILKEPVC